MLGTSNEIVADFTVPDENGPQLQFTVNFLQMFVASLIPAKCWNSDNFMAIATFFKNSEDIVQIRSVWVSLSKNPTMFHNSNESALILHFW